MYTVDISVINLIIYINDNYYRYIFDFSDKENPNYTLKVNWLPIKINEPISINDMNKILSSFKSINLIFGIVIMEIPTVILNIIGY